MVIKHPNKNLVTVDGPPSPSTRPDRSGLKPSSRNRPRSPEDIVSAEAEQLIGGGPLWRRRVGGTRGGHAGRGGFLLHLLLRGPNKIRVVVSLLERLGEGGAPLFRRALHREGGLVAVQKTRGLEHLDLVLGGLEEIPAAIGGTILSGRTHRVAAGQNWVVLGLTLNSPESATFQHLADRNLRVPAG